MVYGPEELKQFENAKKCKIYEGELSKNFTNIDHLAKIKDWLKIMGLPCRIPTYKEVENKMNFYDYIPAEFFQDTKKNYNT